MNKKELFKLLKNIPDHIEIAFDIPGMGDHGNLGRDWEYIEEERIKFIDPETECEFDNNTNKNIVKIIQGKTEIEIEYYSLEYSLPSKERMELNPRWRIPNESFSLNGIIKSISYKEIDEKDN
jgi:hypothetical protein